MELLTVLSLAIFGETSYLTYKVAIKNRKAFKHTHGIIFDTSALIDGRVLAIVRSGFVASELIIPRSVIRELQWMADRADHDKRERARYGLDMVSQLQDLSNVTVTIYDDGETHQEGVDEQLLVIAKNLDAKLCTTDYNLNKVARTENITVVNVNELAHALRPMHLPGEKIYVAIVTAGQNKDQGVGYLDDGTMVVVDNGKKYMGKSIEVETIRVLQTEAGRMVFAKAQSISSASYVPGKQVKTFKKPSHQKNGSGSSHRTQSASAEDALISMANQLNKD